MNLPAPTAVPVQGLLLHHTHARITTAIKGHIARKTEMRATTTAAASLVVKHMAMRAQGPVSATKSFCMIPCNSAVAAIINVPIGLATLVQTVDQLVSRWMAAVTARRRAVATMHVEILDPAAITFSQSVHRVHPKLPGINV